MKKKQKNSLEISRECVIIALCLSEIRLSFTSLTFQSHRNFDNDWPNVCRPLYYRFSHNRILARNQSLFHHRKLTCWDEESLELKNRNGGFKVNKVVGQLRSIHSEMLQGTFLGLFPWLQLWCGYLGCVLFQNIHLYFQLVLSFFYTSVLRLHIVDSWSESITAKLI